MDVGRFTNFLLQRREENESSCLGIRTPHPLPFAFMTRDTISFSSTLHLLRKKRGHVTEKGKNGKQSKSKAIMGQRIGRLHYFLELGSKFHAKRKRGKGSREQNRIKTQNLSTEAGNIMTKLTSQKIVSRDTQKME